MCQFKSGIVLKDGKEKGGFRLIMSPWTESHSELITMFKLNDGKILHFARVEFSPPNLDTAHQVETYKFKIDEDRKPEWFDNKMKNSVIEKMTAYIKSIIVSGDVQLLIGGQFVIAPSAKIECAHTMVINAMCGGTVNDIRGGTVNDIRGGTVNYISGGTVNYISGGTVNDIRGGTVNDIRGGTVNDISGGTVNDIRGGTVNYIRGGTVNYISGGTIKTVQKIWNLVIKTVSKSVKILDDKR